MVTALRRSKRAMTTRTMNDDGWDERASECLSSRVQHLFEDWNSIRRKEMAGMVLSFV
jgi:hypothetical protein